VSPTESLCHRALRRAAVEEQNQRVIDTADRKRMTHAAWMRQEANSRSARAKVERCRLTVLKLVEKAPMVSALETKISQRAFC